LIKNIADAFVTLGLKDAGSNTSYSTTDGRMDGWMDGWMDMQRDAQGNLAPHPERFPNGIKAVADYVHSKGLKFGLYNCAGWRTCAGYPGSRGHEYQDALKYAEWDVDYLKYEWCNTAPLRHMDDKETYAREAYMVMAHALTEAKRPVLFSMCEWGDNNPWKWGALMGHSWRTIRRTSNRRQCANLRVTCAQIHNFSFASRHPYMPVAVSCLLQRIRIKG
jgi:alpha-galactosidase